MNNQAVIVINPGSTSTKLAFYNTEGELFSENIIHPQDELQEFERIADQLDYRLAQILPIIEPYLEKNNLQIIGAVGRGGIVKPVDGGTYRVNEDFLIDARSGEYGEHASNLGSLIVNELKEVFQLKECYTVDPVSTSRISEVAKISGVPGIERSGRAHPLNIKMTVRKIARKLELPFNEVTAVVAHLGGGISIGLVQGGALVDVNDALLGMGPFSPNRAGALPIRGIMKLCYSKPEAEVKKLFSQNSGLKAYLGTEDLRDVLKMVDDGNEKAKLIYEAFVYQVAKEIGAYFAASKSSAKAIGITGGIAYSERFVADLESYVGSLTKFFVFPGESEMEALAEGFYRVYNGEEEALEY
ncbi:MAG: butyrate kinase [Salinivirgaceae bacterium]|nr:MAG: butyrate kinase [Salinivirgaceae bacterium]